MPDSELQSLAARTTARILLEIGAVNFRPEDPYRHTSGNLSPSYIDCRKIIAFPRARQRLTELGLALLNERIGYEQIDAVAGGETAGIPFAAWLADAMALPMLYVRKQPKGFGRMAQIEGVMTDGCRVLLVEDLATDAGSKVGFVEALRQAGGVVTDIYVVFHYGIFPRSTQILADLGVRLHALATWHDILTAARETEAFPAQTLDQVEAYLSDPDGWSRARQDTTE